MTSPETSVIIRAFNEEKYLPALFDAIEEQSYRDFETIVVDSHSYDRTRQIARERADKLVQVERHDFTFGHSLNTGIEASSGDLIAIVSAHTEPTTSDWLEKLVDPLRDEDVAMVYGRQRGTDESKFSEHLDFIRTFGDERKELEPPDFFANNANSAVRRDLWNRHAFDETLPGLEDIEWAKHWMEQGYKVVYQPESTIYHIHEETWPQVRHRYYREAQAAKWIGVEDPSDSISIAVQEIGYLVDDLGKALDRPDTVDTVKEILHFRYNKLRGTLEGLWDGARMENPLERERLYFDKPYQALEVQGPGQAEIVRRDPPEVRPGEVLIRVAYVGVCGTDLEILDGTLGYYEDGTAEYPIVPGHEVSGVVSETGANVDAFEPGDPVVVEAIQGCGRCDPCDEENWIGCENRTELGVIGQDGGFAEYLTVPAHFVQPVLDGVPLEQACLAEPVAVVHKAIRRLHSGAVDVGDARCGVLGAGPIGNLTAQLLARDGHPVTVHDREAERSRTAAKSHKRIEATDQIDPVLEADVVVEATGNPEALETVLEGTPAGATLLLLGLPYGERSFNFEEIVAYDKAVLGSVGSTSEDFEAAARLVPKLDLDPLTDHVVPLEDYGEAFEALRSQAYLKTIVEVDGSVDRRGDSAG